MTIKDRAKRDIGRILGNSNEYQAIVFFAPNGTTATVTGFHAKIHLGVDTDGNIVNSLKTWVSVSEKALTDLGYTTRNSNGEAQMVGHKLHIADSTDVVKKYIVQNVIPDETVGILTFTLEYYE